MAEQELSNANKGKLGEELVAKYLVKKGYNILKQNQNGCDIVAQKNDEEITVEVKTSSTDSGIPDMNKTEFESVNNEWFLIADYLYIVRLNKNNKPFRLDILTKYDVDKYSDSHKIVTRIRTTKLDKDLKLGVIGEFETIEI